MIPDVNRIIAENITQQMKEKKLKQLDLADYLGLSKQTVSMMLKGERTISAYEMKCISSFLGVPMNRLLYISDDIITVKHDNVAGVKPEEEKLFSFIDKLSSFILFNRKAKANGMEAMEPWD